MNLWDVMFLNTPFSAAMHRYEIDGPPASWLALCGMNEAPKTAFDSHGVGLPTGQGFAPSVYERVEAGCAAPILGLEQSEQAFAVEVAAGGGDGLFE